MARILLVEDEPAVLELLAEVLTRAGHAVTPAGTVEEGLRELGRNGAFDLLLSDHHLCGRTSLELIAHVRTSGMSTRVLVMSGQFVAQPKLVSQVLEAGADAVLDKPFRLEAFLAAVEVVLSPV